MCLPKMDTKDDRECLWTFNRLMEKTEPYCFRSEDMIDTAGMLVLAGWWLSKLAYDDVDRFECLN